MSKKKSDQGRGGGEANRMWGGRFSGGPAQIMEQINASINFDRRLYAQDIAASKAHAEMLAAARIISEADAKAISDGLDTIRAEIEAGEFAFTAALEDIHMHVEARLGELIGEAAGRLHTARSRNDQVATDLRLWLRDQIDAQVPALNDLISALLDKAGDHAATVMPGLTHLQGAQPVTLGHHLMAYVEMFLRDRSRLTDCRERLNECPLGAAALAGTSFPIDRAATSKALGFGRPMPNSMDAVSDRDFVLEYMAAAAITMTHISRLAEELVLWSSDRFGFLHLSDAFSTGSSIMPQKRNPDAAELCRAKAGRVVGALTGMLTVMKALPLTYSKDLQEDKEPLFDVVDTVGLSLAVMSGMIGDLDVDEKAMAAAAGEGYSTATDIADWLVRELGLPFREAHGLTGQMVHLAEKGNCRLQDLALADLQALEPGITEDVFGVLSVEDSVASRSSLGGTSPDQVREAVAAARARLEAGS